MVHSLSNTGADPEFSNRGGAKDYNCKAHIPSAEREVPYGRGPGSSRVLDALSCYPSRMVKHSDTNLTLKKHSRSKFRGGGGGHAPVAPLPGSATAIELLPWNTKKYMQQGIDNSSFHHRF